MLKHLTFAIWSLAAMGLITLSTPAIAATRVIESKGSSSMPSFKLLSRNEAFKGEYGQDWIFQDSDGSIPEPGKYPKVTMTEDGDTLSIHISSLPAGMAENVVRTIEIKDISKKQTTASLYVHNFAGKVLVGSSQVSIECQAPTKSKKRKSCNSSLKKTKISEEP